MRARPNVVLLVIAVLVAGLALTAAVVAANRRPSGPDLSTPEGVVQAYVAAVVAGDPEQAVAFLEPDLRCPEALPSAGQPRTASLRVLDTRTSDSSARVEVEITERAGAPLPGIASGARVDFELVSREGHWLITGHPWPFDSCKGE